MAAELTVAVIGSARVGPPDPRCGPAEQIGAAVAARGWTVLTGGYGGLMEVTSRAAAEAGGRVVGVPVRGWTQLTPNRWNHELRWTDTYPERLGHFLAAAHLTIDDRDLALVTICADAGSVVAHIAQTRAGRPRAADPRG
jgi:predicted Rossmann-fold nucleotide-binding protein